MIHMTANLDSVGYAFRPDNLGMGAGRAGSTPAWHDLELAVGGRQRKALSAGESLFLQGDEIRSVCVLQEGWAFRYQCLEDGRRQIVDFLLPGDILGMEAPAAVQYGVEALSRCTWITMPRDGFMEHLRQRPALGLKLLDALAAGQNRAFEQITSLGRRTARERLAHLLLDLARRVRRSMADCEGAEIGMPLMLSHLGDALGLATETVCRCLGDLKRAGILVFGAGRLEILDLAGLSELAGVPVGEGADMSRHRDIAA